MAMYCMAPSGSASGGYLKAFFKKKRVSSLSVTVGYLGTTPTHTVSWGANDPTADGGPGGGRRDGAGGGGEVRQEACGQKTRCQGCSGQKDHRQEDRRQKGGDRPGGVSSIGGRAPAQGTGRPGTSAPAGGRAAPHGCPAGRPAVPAAGV